jgi:hypothetical protein
MKQIRMTYRLQFLGSAVTHPHKSALWIHVSASEQNCTVVPEVNYARSHEDAWRMEAWLHAFLTSALDGGEWSSSRPEPFTAGK